MSQFFCPLSEEQLVVNNNLQNQRSYHISSYSFRAWLPRPAPMYSLERYDYDYGYGYMAYMLIVFNICLIPVVQELCQNDSIVNSFGSVTMDIGSNLSRNWFVITFPTVNTWYQRYIRNDYQCDELLILKPSTTDTFFLAKNKFSTTAAMLSSILRQKSKGGCARHKILIGNVQ